MTLTDHTFALPSTLKDKDRFLPIFTLVDWMDRIDAYGHKLDAGLRAMLDQASNRWLDLRLRQVHQLVVTTASILKTQGLGQAARDRLVVRL